MNPKELLDRLHGLGYALCLEGEGVRFKYIHKGAPPIAVARPLFEEIKNNKQAVLDVLRASLPKPLLEPDGGLVIPFGSESKYQWWAGGQKVKDTIEELKGAFNA